MEQRDATSEIRLHVSGARYRKRYFADPAQITWFGNGRGFDV
jgi:hypothetical protein